MTFCIGRREFITLLAGAAAAWPLAARAQQAERMRRIGVLLSGAANNPDVQVWLAAFLQGLLELGWSEGRNLRIEYRLGALGDVERTRKYAAELVALAPDVIFASGTAQVGPLLQATRTVPIIFAIVADPVGAGFVDSLARPGGNITGVVFQQIELAQKQVELLTQAFPSKTRLAILFDGQSADQFSAAEAIAKSLNLRVQALKLENPPYDFAAAFSSATAGGAEMMLVLSSPFMTAHRSRVAELAIAHRLPCMYIFKLWAEVGGLMSYGVEFPRMYRQAADYVARILKGAKPADLPVEQASKFELVINLKTAKAIGIEFPTGILLRADEVIE
jgi:putative tryptophan/tyrosine transport system substrate-binding protein